ncbi:bifunctional folylpolyglutamate synthase/dihydrofolate synthase [Lachnospiraceae bacterium AM48-27BH]|nr:bifunctional folylpolyglutamate synthase/dihydrofolate synthase [Lachnospiraceae bacterium AM48-27BH]
MSAVEEYLERIPMWAAKKNSLEDVRAYLEEMGSPDRGMKIIHVAGTNGKGSVCSYLTSMLTETGYKVGTFISPHLEEIRERFLMNGDLVREDTYERAFYRVKELSEKMVEKGYQPPTYFEFLFYMCMAVNEQCKPDFVILETGLGGRLDVTNVVEHPVLTVITSISMDHMQYLGNTIEEIAGEKAGILKPGVPVVYDASCEESRTVIEARAMELKCPKIPVGRDAYTFMKRDAKRPHRSPDVGWRSACGDSAVPGGISADERFCRSEGYEYPSENGLCWFSLEDIVQGILQGYWPGRMERVLPGVYLDGAHNAGGIEALHETMTRMQKETGKSISILFGAVADKEHKKMIQNLCQDLNITHVTIAHMETSRCADTEQLKGEFAEVLNCPVEIFQTVEEGWKHFLENQGDGLAFCAGSLYLIGEVKSLLKPKEAEDD